jgi:hypothetical protein
MNEENKFEHTLSEFIDLRLIDSCKDVEEWIKGVSEALKAESGLELGPKDEVEDKVIKYVEEKRNDGRIIWSESLGTIVSL